MLARYHFHEMQIVNLALSPRLIELGIAKIFVVREPKAAVLEQKPEAWRIRQGAGRGRPEARSLTYQAGSRS